MALAALLGAACLPAWRAPTLSGEFAVLPSIAGETTGLSVTSEVLPCAWISSIWSQTAQSYSQLVDFGGPDSTLLPGRMSSSSGSRVLPRTCEATVGTTASTASSR